MSRSLISLGQSVFDPARHPSLDGASISSTDAKRMLEAYIAVEIADQVTKWRGGTRAQRSTTPFSFSIAGPRISARRRSALKRRPRSLTRSRFYPGAATRRTSARGLALDVQFAGAPPRSFAG